MMIQEETTRGNLKCTCGPFPLIEIDISTALSDDTNKNNIQVACCSHGCFHLMVNNGTETNLFLRDDLVTVQRKLESMFSPDNLSKKNCFKSVYRGRLAESGATIESEINGEEPKQSWEYRRCTQMNVSKAVHERNEVDDNMQHFINFLHKVATILEDYMQLQPKGSMIVYKPCDCKTETDSECCNHDLLRLFRYDASEDEFSLGSSPHTDWGTLTIVWQDDVGGLETFCHAHQKWNTVPALCDSNSMSCRFFVHVGDFLSLSHGKVPGQSSMRWPSPLHRVVSPPKGKTRFSLVYFLYPRNDVTLDDAESAFQKEYCDFEPCREDSLLSQFFVLRDQSSSKTAKLTPLEVLLDILDKPFASEVIAAKWKQVQR